MVDSGKDHFKNIISRIKAALGFDSDLELAAFLGIKSQGITRAKTNGVPNNWIDRATNAGVSKRWILLGQWPMMGGEEMGPQGKGPLDIKDADKARYNELIEKTSKVITSKTIFNSALARNIDAFHQAIETEEEMQGVKKEMRLMREDYTERMDRMEKLLAQNLGADKKRDEAANS